MPKLISDICKNSIFLDERFCMSSSVKTHRNCSLKSLAFEQSDFAGNPALVLKVGMPVSSLRRAMVYDKEDEELSFRLAATMSCI